MNGDTTQGCDVYIGRNIQNGRWDLPQTEWSNPFYEDLNTWEKSHKEYEKYIRGNETLWAKLDELEGKTLGCWCKPAPCHGDVLVRLLEVKKQIKIENELNLAGLHVKHHSDIIGIRNARKWANHPQWLAHATRLDSTNIFYFEPNAFSRLRTLIPGDVPEFWYAFTDEERPFIIVGEYYGDQPLGPFWRPDFALNIDPVCNISFDAYSDNSCDIEEEQGVLAIGQAICEFAEAIQPAIDANRAQFQSAFKKGLAYFRLHRAIVRKVGDALGIDMDDHDLTKTRIIQLALAYRWHWSGAHDPVLRTLAENICLKGHNELENHHPQFAIAGHGPVDEKKLLVDVLSAHMQKDKPRDQRNGWDVSLTYIPPELYSTWVQFRDKYGHINLYEDAYDIALGEILWEDDHSDPENNLNCDHSDYSALMKK